MGVKTKEQPKWAGIARSAMKAKGITQEDLIETFEVGTRGAVGHYFTGRREPTIEQLQRLAKKLNISLSALAGEGLSDSQEAELLAKAQQRLSEAKGKDKEMLVAALNHILK